MRTKIIAVNAAIVALVGLLLFVLVRLALVAASANAAELAGNAKRAAEGSAARFQLDGLRIERWIAGKATEPAGIDVLSKADPSGSARSVCDAILSDAKRASFGALPSVVFLVDARGRSVGRSGSSVHGEDYAAAYPALRDALATGKPASDVWVNPARSEQFLVSFAPVKSEKGALLGAYVAGFNLSDEMARVVDVAAGVAVRLVQTEGNGVKLLSNSGSSSQLDAALTSRGGLIKDALLSGHSAALPPQDDVLLGASPLDSLADGKKVGIVVGGKTDLLENPANLLLPQIAGVTLLGLLLVIVGGWLLGGYITSPINELEEGLLAILNGQSDKRFQLDHPDLGGLAFRIDQLLNQLMGVEEDTTDDEGRVSKAPSEQNFTDAMSVERKSGLGGAGEVADPEEVARLAAEAEPAYYARIYSEYITAKKGLGEATDHITDAAFKDRIQGMEREASAKYGKPVRYKVQARGREVVLLAIPLG